MYIKMNRDKKSCDPRAWELFFYFVWDITGVRNDNDDLL